MAERSAQPGKHVARHRAPTGFERACDRLADGLERVSRPRLSAAALGRPVAVTAAGGVLAAAAVIGGQVLSDEGVPTSPEAGASAGASSDLGAREAAADDASRDSSRPSLGALKQRALQSRTSAVGRHRGAAAVATEEVVDADSDPRDIARAMLAQYGWSESEFYCLDQLWIGESNWDWSATNPTSGAYGIPQSLPPEKMAAAGPDWRTNPVTQIEWGLWYIDQSYGTPCAANAFKVANNWY